MKVTYVVERGSFNEVANETTALATIRFTEARNRSKEGAFPLVEEAALYDVPGFRRREAVLFNILGMNP